MSATLLPVGYVLIGVAIPIVWMLIAGWLRERRYKQFLHDLCVSNPRTYYQSSMGLVWDWLEPRQKLQDQMIMNDIWTLGDMIGEHVHKLTTKERDYWRERVLDTIYYSTPEGDGPHHGAINEVYQKVARVFEAKP